MFLSNEVCTVWSVAKVLVVQFSLGYGGLTMKLVPHSIHYHNKIIFSAYLESNDSDYDNYDYLYLKWIHYISVIVPAEYYQPDMIYLITGGLNKSLDTQEWTPIKFDNINKAYGTIINDIHIISGYE